MQFKTEKKLLAWHMLMALILLRLRAGKYTCISLPQDYWSVPTASNLPMVTFLFLDSRMTSTLNAEAVSTYLPGFLWFLKPLEERLRLCHFTFTSQHSSDI